MEAVSVHAVDEAMDVSQPLPDASPLSAVLTDWLSITPRWVKLDVTRFRADS
ncbi:hypothetical protein J2W40_001150 [Sphingobium xenophagum]|uniref:Uncharacterized protein n=1 Tax=Sphingobium xenophagum TaxID=121428 RepID=A0ABU1WYE1_SPHXE|nr:hypothetical protein [Sphingobium xenophagum]